MDLKEWAESLYRQGDAQLADYGKEILEVINQCEELLYRLYQIEGELEEQARRHCMEYNDPLRIIKKLARTVADIQETLEKMGGYVVDDISALDLLVQELCQRPKYNL